MARGTEYEPRHFSIFPVRMRGELRPVPVLVIDRDGTPSVFWEAVKWVMAQACRGCSFSRMKAAVYTLGMLWEFIQEIYGHVEVRPDKLPALIREFLIARRTGQGPDGQSLGWSLVQAARNRMDRSYLREFSDFCVLEFRYWPLVPKIAHVMMQPGTRSLTEFYAEVQQKERDMLAHLNRYRRRKPAPAVGLIDRSRSWAQHGRSAMHPTIEHIEQTIYETRSPMLRMLLIHLAFGGVRLSEALHTWRCDLLPGQFRKDLFWGDEASELPLLVLAHPQDAKYIGPLRPSQKDRTQHLQEQFGRLPRNLLEGTSEWLGHKGYVIENTQYQISQVYWSHPRWAVRYYDCYTEFRDTIWRQVPPTLRDSHPYLYVNDDPTQWEFFGVPLKRGNARKAIARAMDRAGVPAQYKRGSHGLRHAYKGMLDALGLTPPQIRICMHHVSTESQDAYGKDSAALYRRLKDAVSQERMIA